MNTLRGTAIALSVSDAPDRTRLGFPAQEVQRILFSVCTALIREGCEILYAGDLRPGGYTLSMFTFLAGTYAGQGIAPFTNILPEPVVRSLGFEALKQWAKAARGVATLTLSIDAKLFPVRSIGEELLIGERSAKRQAFKNEAQFSAWLKSLPFVDPAVGFSQARYAISQSSAGRISMGGKMGLTGRKDDQYEGGMPGIAEEAILSLEAGKAYIPLGAFGGATRDVAIALDLLPDGAKTPRGKQADTYAVAMERLTTLRDQLPAAQIEPLRALAKNENAEDIAQASISVIAGWGRS